MSGWVAGAVVVGAVGGSIIQGQAAQSAAQTQANAAMQAANINEQMYNQTVQREAPFVQGGQGALSQLDYLMGIGGNPQQGVAQGGQGAIGAAGGPTGMGAPTGNYASLGGAGGGPMGGSFGGFGPLTVSGGGAAGVAGAGVGASAGQPAGQPGSAAAPSGVGGYGSLNQPFTAQMMQQYSPAYGFQLQQGQQATRNMDASGQGSLSGSALKDLISFNQNYANTAFNSAFNQYQTQQSNTYNRLSGLTQIGSSAAANLGSQGVAAGGNIGSAIANVGASQAAGTIGAANAYAGGINNAIPWLMAGTNASPNAGGGYATNAPWASGAYGGP